MSTTTTQEQKGKIIVGPLRLSFVHVWEPTAMEGQADKKYSLHVLIPKDDKATIARINAAIEAAMEEGKATKWKGKIPKKCWNPLQDGDTEKADYEEYSNMLYVAAKSSTKPGIVDKNRQPILAQDEVYSGIYGYVSINFYPFDKNGNAGVAAGLNNVMKVKDGPALGGRSSADSDFAEINVEDDDDLM